VWQEWTDSCLAVVDIYKDLIDRANDIYYSRVEKLLESITDVKVSNMCNLNISISDTLLLLQLYELPTSQPWTMER
jgi:hypothetical protein